MYIPKIDRYKDYLYPTYQAFIFPKPQDSGGGGAIKIVMGWKNDSTAAEDLDLHLNEFTNDFKKKTCSVWGIEFYKNNNKYDRK